MIARFPASQGSRHELMRNELFRGDLDAYARSLDSARANTTDISERGWVLARRAEQALFRGRLGEADALSASARAADSALGRTVTPGITAAARLMSLTDRRVPAEAAVRALDSALAHAPLNRQPEVERPYFEVARAYASAGRVDRAKQMLALSETEVRDTALKRAKAPDRHRANAAIAAAEKRWRDAADERRKADSLPDGPVDMCAFCLPLDLMRLFAEAGMVDSALAQHARYRETVIGGRPMSGPDMLLSAEGYELLAQLYEKKGDAAKATESYRIVIELWKNADPVLQPRVAEARRRLSALTKLEQPPRR